MSSIDSGRQTRDFTDSLYFDLRLKILAEATRSPSISRTISRNCDR
ncbi:hypothetical protein [Almyronema epifaneia]|uniref:Uncharacterized protein n=1 Tax=Almyronema epifaneia S1 TaxID=2991925 RepID=A0ABW6ILE1_9CYAN